ncbi:hypothetical protein [Micromonospora carbonacea]|uniref:Uncharacterized protein n=1 Tax=Micromonospora carbonacea TaxID=47853 RepID=A0A1C5AD38_9ACTN|nr:hypothetical protein [Micromonospora carbonacea]SCF43147.1 hypothetical protein GA0070563_112194 [Micromonospora carbonacea]
MTGNADLISLAVVLALLVLTSVVLTVDYWRWWRLVYALRNPKSPQVWETEQWWGIVADLDDVAETGRRIAAAHGEVTQ